MFAMATGQQKQQNSNESLHSGSALKAASSQRLGPTCAHAQGSFAAARGCSDWKSVAGGGGRLSLIPLCLPFYHCWVSAADPTFAILSAPSFHAVFKPRGLDVLGVY